MLASRATDSLALPAFVISIVAAFTALAALTWNILQWIWSGPRVRVRTHVHLLDENHVGLGAYVWNKGRAPIDIVAAEVQRDRKDDFDLVPLLGVEDPGLPHRLEPGSSVVLETEFSRPGSYFGAKWYQTVVTLANGDITKSPRVRALR